MSWFKKRFCKGVSYEDLAFPHPSEVQPVDVCGSSEISTEAQEKARQALHDEVVREQERSKIEANVKLEEFRAYGRQQEDEWTKQAAEIHAQVFRRNHETDYFLEYDSYVLPCAQIERIEITNYGLAPQWAFSQKLIEYNRGSYDVTPFQDGNSVEVWHNDYYKIFRGSWTACIKIHFRSGQVCNINHNHIVILSLYEALIDKWKGPEYNVAVQEPSDTVLATDCPPHT